MEPHATGTVEVNGITIAYETIGDPTAVPVLLIMGLGAQLITWPDELCAELVDRGTYVIRFDNRDAGRSTHLTGQPAPRPLRSVLRLQRPTTPRASWPPWGSTPPMSSGRRWGGSSPRPWPSGTRRGSAASPSS
jgi:pimeloyl-ACP methyl ester carboxylesterase